MRWLLVLGLFVGALLWLWRSANDAPVVAEQRAPTPATSATPRRSALLPAASQVRLTLPPRPSAFDASSQHTADPCTALEEPRVPATFESITAANVTIAWEPVDEGDEPPFRPVSLAYTVAGLLEEAAQLTGTERREALTVIVDATPQEFQARYRVPAWVGGFYDGAAIFLPARPTADLGVAMTTLRHEVMHAQMHAAIGCTPFWFNEGMANYFAGSTPAREWFAMMRTAEPFDLATLGRPAILEVQAESAKRMYAVSLAMVVFLVHRGGEVGLREAVRVAQSADSIATALDLWSRIAPNIDHRAVVDSLAQRVFGMPPGPELDALVQGRACCQDLRSPARFTCRAPPATAATTGTSLGDGDALCRRW